MLAYLTPQPRLKMASLWSENVSITNVNAKGFAFAKTAAGANVFISPPVFNALGNPGKGEHVKLKVKMGDKGLVAVAPPAMPLVAAYDGGLANGG